MPRQPTTAGTCGLCGQTFSKTGVARHLPKCRADHAHAKGKKLHPTFLVMVEGRYLPDYWLVGEISAAETLDTLDAFLRDIWLECCGHMSAFTIGDTQYMMDTGGIDGMWLDLFGSSHPTKSMSKVRLDEVLKPGLKFYHEYDFGTTTELTLKVLAEQEGATPKRALDILSRNHPPPIKCDKCAELAVEVCVECIYDGKGWLCAKHAKQHKHDDMFLPVVNSPRVGQCGYTGPLKD